jgi:hypothetical protein
VHALFSGRSYEMCFSKLISFTTIAIVDSKQQGISLSTHSIRIFKICIENDVHIIDLRAASLRRIFGPNNK